MNKKTWRALSYFIVVISACVVSYEFFDAPAARFCAGLDPRIKEVFESITLFGLSTPYLIAALAGFFYFKFLKKKQIGANAAAFLFIAVALSGLSNDLIKILIGRARPVLLLSQGIYGFKPFTNQYYYASFPSGHSNTIAALSYGLVAITGRYRYLLTFIALAVMSSRIIVGAHFPSDVLFGAYLGIVVSELLILIFSKKGFPIARRSEKLRT